MTRDEDDWAAAMVAAETEVQRLTDELDLARLVADALAQHCRDLHRERDTLRIERDAAHQEVALLGWRPWEHPSWVSEMTPDQRAEARDRLADLPDTLGHIPGEVTEWLEELLAGDDRVARWLWEQLQEVDAP
jgi:hypothetical protein